ncbi:SpoIIE family protein phosphatase [Nocardioides zeae]|uniref:SpoIIE family protein phosphatase n=1 Tax=Nocardioides imazamoxiresistens TaxID=3231893 RepID=A0ABU3PV86_9ACTN|nr:SpoIIE family protein phosphatase [Nocardioides zeae]MDT9593152.1 SpoIIE family protein phosphatase [Nocardioides zeae]
MERDRAPRRPIATHYDQVDWAATPLGPRDAWSPLLRSTLDLVLRTRFPASLVWGEELVLLYNEAYAARVGAKHPAALGRPAPAVFPEAWGAVGPLVQRAMSAGESSSLQDAAIPLDRRGFLEESFFSASHSPVVAEDGRIAGVLEISVETTDQVRVRRRLQVLGELAEALADVQDLEELSRTALRLLRDRVPELPVVDIRLPGVTPSDAQRDRPEGYDPERPGLWFDRSAHPAATAGPTGLVAWQSLAGPHLGDVEPVRGPLAPTDQAVVICEVSPSIGLDVAYRQFLRLVAHTLTQAFARIGALQRERDQAAGDRAMSLELQRSLLTSPVAATDLDGVELAVRYEPAASREQVGGDWHDAFCLPGGRLMVAVGDVAGHDRHAAGVMAQVRNLTRGIAHQAATGPGVLDDPDLPGPAQVLEHLDAATYAFRVGTVTTCVLATLHAEEGGHRLRWSSAGHPPPVLLLPDGSVTTLEGSDPLLGMDHRLHRTDHEVLLAPGSTLLMYTDGLVERRKQLLDEGIDRVRAAVAGRTDLAPEALCDHVLAALAPYEDDDVAMLALRTAPPQ